MLWAWSRAREIHICPAESYCAFARNNLYISLFVMKCSVWFEQLSLVFCVKKFHRFLITHSFVTIDNASAMYSMPCSVPCKSLWYSVVVGSIFEALSPSSSSVSKCSPLVIHCACFASRPPQSLLLSPHPRGKRVKQNGDSVLGHRRKISQCACVRLLSSSSRPSVLNAI